MKSLNAEKDPPTAVIEVGVPKFSSVEIAPIVLPEALNSGKTVTSEELLVKTLPLTIVVEAVTLENSSEVRKERFEDLIFS